MQGALFGARALASGLGPLAFAALFAAFTMTESPLPYFPGAPFVLGAVLMAGTAALAATLPADAGGNAGTLFGGPAVLHRVESEGGLEGESGSLLHPAEGESDAEAALGRRRLSSSS